MQLNCLEQNQDLRRFISPGYVKATWILDNTADANQLPSVLSYWVICASGVKYLISNQHIVYDIIGSLWIAEMPRGIFSIRQDPLRWILGSTLSITLKPTVLSYWVALCEICYIRIYAGSYPLDM